MANPQQKSNREHSFDSELASLVGIEKAILLKNISYWVDENERKKLESSFAYGKWWTFESLTSLTKKYPYMKRGNLSRWFKELKRDKWILMYSTTDGANMYTTGAVFNSWNLGQDWKGVFQNETGREWGEVFQNETKAVFQNETKGAAQNETHNNVEKDIEKNVELEGEREAKKTPPPPTTYDEMMAMVNAEARDVEAKKEKKDSPGAAAKLLHQYFAEMPENVIRADFEAAMSEISEEIDELKNGVVRRENHAELREAIPKLLDGLRSGEPTHIIKSTDTQTLPGALITEVAGIHLEETTRLPVSLRSRPNAETPAELQAAMRGFYTDYPNEWKDNVLQISKGGRYPEEKQKEIVLSWCCHVVKEGLTGRTYGQMNAHLQAWFLKQPDADRWSESKTAQQKSGTQETRYASPANPDKIPAYTP